jgi:hypothetical protein
VPPFAAQALAGSAAALPFFFVVVGGISREGTKGVENSHLPAFAKRIL